MLYYLINNFTNDYSKNYAGCLFVIKVRVVEVKFSDEEPNDKKVLLNADYMCLNNNIQMLIIISVFVTVVCDAQ